jgi:hypothetical protein
VLRGATVQSLVEHSIQVFAGAGWEWSAGGWRRLSPSAELLIDPESLARCAIRDSRRSGAERYLWTLTVRLPSIGGGAHRGGCRGAFTGRGCVFSGVFSIGSITGARRRGCG